MTKEDELNGIVAALDALLTAIKADNERRRGDFKVARTLDITEWTFEETQLELAVLDLVRNPVGQALRNGVKLIGERLHESGGISLMHDALGAVCKLSPDDNSWREAMLDRLFSGIGSWEA